MNDCRSCEFAVYCYAEPSTWVFRTLDEMKRTQKEIARCPISKQTAGDPGGQGRCDEKMR